MLLSTMHQTTDISLNHKNKPEINLSHNEHKGGVDTLDEMVHTYSCKRKTNRWPFAVFQNICGVAAYVIWSKLNPFFSAEAVDSRREKFLEEVSEAQV